MVAFESAVAAAWIERRVEQLHFFVCVWSDGSTAFFDVHFGFLSFGTRRTLYGESALSTIKRASRILTHLL